MPGLQERQLLGHQLGSSPRFPLQQRWCFRIQGIGGEWHVIQAFPNHHSLGDGWEFGPLLNHHSRSWSKPLTSGRRVFGSTLTPLAHQHWLFWAPAIEVQSPPLKGPMIDERNWNVGWSLRNVYRLVFSCDTCLLELFFWLQGWWNTHVTW